MTNPEYDPHNFDPSSDDDSCTVCGLDLEGHARQARENRLERCSDPDPEPEESVPWTSAPIPLPLGAAEPSLVTMLRKEAVAHDELVKGRTEAGCCPLCGGTKPEHRGQRQMGYGGGLCMNPYHAGYIGEGEAAAITANLAGQRPPTENPWSRTAPTEVGFYPTYFNAIGEAAPAGRSPLTITQVELEGGMLVPRFRADVRAILNDLEVFWGPKLDMPELPEEENEKSGSEISAEMRAEMRRIDDEIAREAGASLVCSTCRGPRAVRPGSCSSDFHPGPNDLVVTMDNGSEVVLGGLAGSEKLFSSQPPPGVAGAPPSPTAQAIKAGIKVAAGELGALMTPGSPADAFTKLSMADKVKVIEAMKPGDSMEVAMRTLDRRVKP